MIFVNGEGRGHLTQALGFKEIVERNGYIIIGCFLGTTNNKKIPDYFNELNCPIYPFESPQFVKIDNKGISISKTILNTLKNTRRYIASIKNIKQIVKTNNPDIITNFYEPLFGLFNITNKIPSISIGHQYYLELNKFDIPNSIDKYLLFLNNKLSSLNSQIWCLSFTDDISYYKIIPPILRNTKSLIPSNSEGCLAYICNEGYINELDNTGLEILCYMKTDNTYTQNNMVVTPLSENFIDDLKRCEHYISTSGFESICEAYYLGKNIHVVPIDNHFEQLCNSLDSERLGIAKRYEQYSDISLDTKIVDNTEFKIWVDSAESKIIELLNTI